MRRGKVRTRRRKVIYREAHEGSDGDAHCGGNGDAYGGGDMRSCGSASVILQ